MMSIADEEKRQSRKAENGSRSPAGATGETRRDFLCVAAGAGIALALRPSSSAQASDRGTRDWEWVGPFEVYDRRFEYMYVYEDGVPDWESVDGDEGYEGDEGEDPGYDYAYLDENGMLVEGEWVDPDEPEDPEYDYMWAYEWEDGTPIAWTYVNAEVPFDDDGYEYVNEDGSPIVWEDVEPGELRHPYYHYVQPHEYVDENGLPSEYEWTQVGEVWSPEFDYVYEYKR